MVEPVMQTRTWTTRAGGTWLLVLALPLAAALAAPAVPAPAASPLADPTQAPAGYAPPSARGSSSGAIADPATASDPLRLQMIVRSGNSRYALIDGRKLRAGESIALPDGQARVERIDDDAVQVRMPGAHEVKTLFLNGVQSDALDIRHSGVTAKDALEKR